ncbi:MAG TPA: hypothetical protein GXX33_08505 [Firmicutes bacterium]|uniref:GTP cyclohydrolase 1 type 2 homolog n=1 Tax=Capillibacterium thermochitinicola TaxID=2699427 RepID=A0A8J6I0G9_9FIRM|nr:Nif3-like dinuclear metal center hexameric protein [Capillibacterium thermochitinicola]MBA2133003.1 Nif3-like dinuclear metal center hexameric protein [Capillibacterium thermochitinicola]HHW13024.1 hypothetical protein [Bacillota bacterium]
MIELEKFQAIIEELAPAALADKYDPPHFWRKPGKKLQKIGVCVDPTVQNVRMAQQDGVDLLISHHPCFEQDEELFAGQEMGVFVLHSAWNKAPDGNTAVLARLLNLRETVQDGELLTGRVEVSLRDLLLSCQRLLNTPVMPYVGDLNAKVHHVLLISGPGFAPFYKEEWDKYIAGGCDTILSAELGRFALSYLSRHNIKMIDLGHSAMARPGMEHLAYTLQTRLKIFQCQVNFYPDLYAVNYQTASFYPGIEN